MSGIRSILRNPTVRGIATDASAPFYCDSDDNKIKVIPAGTGTTEVTLLDSANAIPSSANIPYLSDVTNITGAKKIAYGSSALVSGAKTVATGLATVLSFQTQLAATGFATGATEATALVINAATGVAATGDVAVLGYRLFTTTASASGTGVFDWIAIGT